MALDSAGVEKGEVIPDSAAPKSDFLPFVKLLFDCRYGFGDPNWSNENLSQQIGLVMNEAPQEIKVKISESRLLKFY